MGESQLWRKAAPVRNICNSRSALMEAMHSTSMSMPSELS